MGHRLLLLPWVDLPSYAHAILVRLDFFPWTNPHQPLYTANYGFSLGINDVIPGEVLKQNKDRLVEKAYTECDALIEEAKKGKLENKPGCNQEQTLEAMVGAVLSKVRDEVGKICMMELSRHNAPLIMATCGSKGR